MSERAGGPGHTPHDQFHIPRPLASSDNRLLLEATPPQAAVLEGSEGAKSSGKEMFTWDT